jgi:hypothetical protein
MMVRMRRALGGVIWLAACGRLGFDGRTSSDAASCAWTAFSAPQRLPGPVQTAGDDWSPTPTLGQTELYTDGYQSGATADLYMASRTSTSAEFSASSLVPAVSTATADEFGPTLTEDGLVIVYTTGTNMTAPTRLWMAVRAAASDPWPSGKPIPELVTAIYYDYEGWLSADGLRLIFATDRPGSLGGFDLAETTRPDRQSAFAAPHLLTEVSSTSNDEGPTLSRDGLELFFVSSRPGGPGLTDVYRATRTSIDQPFDAPQLVPELSSAMGEYYVRLTPDGTTMYFNYDTLAAGGANADLWIATRTCQ